MLDCASDEKLTFGLCRYAEHGGVLGGKDLGEGNGVCAEEHLRKVLDYIRNGYCRKDYIHSRNVLLDHLAYNAFFKQNADKERTCKGKNCNQPERQTDETVESDAQVSTDGDHVALTEAHEAGCFVNKAVSKGDKTVDTAYYQAVKYQ